MEFELTEEQKAWQQEVRAFIRENVTPELMEEVKDSTSSHGPHHKAWSTSKWSPRKWACSP